MIKSLYESLVRCFKILESLHDSRAYFVNPFEETRPRRQTDFASFDVIGKPFTNPLKGMRQPTTIATLRNSLNFENPEYQEKIVETPSNPFSPYNMSTQVNPFIEQPTERFREFKIHGSIGAEGQKDKLSYSSLMYQIQDGQKKRFSEIDICAGVIRAITPGNPLRPYLEGRAQLSVSSMKQILRSHFQEKDATSLFADLCSASQSPGESAQDFVIRTIATRQKVLIISEEEGFPYDPDLVKRRFFHAIVTGLRNPHIISELKPLLKKDCNISDEKLLENLNLAVADENERYKKAKYVGTNKIFVKENENGYSGQNDPQQKNNSVNIQLDNLKKQVAEISLSLAKNNRDKEIDQNSLENPSLAAELRELQTKVQEISAQQRRHFDRPANLFGNFRSPSINRPDHLDRRNRCINCRRNNVRGPCLHCYRCGNVGHRRSECTKPVFDINAPRLPNDTLEEKNRS